MAPEYEWFKSSYSEQSGGNCVEVANLIAAQALVAVRDSKSPDHAPLLLSPRAFAAFVNSR